ncbi:phosphate uptake regulator PhoU [Candidatus Woesearchaeota archaeon]|nr:phosphate uptake regulator PhoU [Candidatus Woesearchaeota archaeon]
MKRKIIKLGQATYVMSLPSAWIRENKLDKGDYLEVAEEEGVLKLSSGQVKKGKTLQLNITKLNDKLTAGNIETAYLLGYETVELIHNPTISVYSHVLRPKKERKSTELLQELVNQKLIGMEIVEQSEKRTVIKDLGAGVDTESAQNIFNRILFLLSSQAAEVLSGLKAHDKDKLKVIQPSFSNTRRFILYYSRLLSMVSYSREEVKIRNNITEHFNTVNSSYKSIVNMALSLEKINYSKNALFTLELINNHLRDLRDLCLNYNLDKAIELLNNRERVWNEGYAQKATVNDLPLYWNLGALMGAAWFITKELYGLNMKGS